MAIQPHSRIESQLTDPTYNGPYLSRIELILKDMLENYGRIALVGPYDSLEDLPETGQAGYVYLVRVEGSNLCDEYIWDEQEEEYNYVGRFEIDLADYQTKTLSNPITIDSVVYTTVESALTAMNTSLSGKANSSDLGTAASKNSTNQLSDGSVDLIEAGAVKTALDGKEKSGVAETLVKDTVGWTGKNQVLTDGTNKTEGGVTFKVKDDGTISAIGNSSETVYAWFHVLSNQGFNALGLEVGESYILSGTTADKSVMVYIETTSNVHVHEDTTGEGVTFTYNGETNWRIGSLCKKGESINAIIKPMLRKADIADPTFEPYHATVDTVKADKVTNATSGHLAGLDANGNLTDSGVSPTELMLNKIYGFHINSSESDPDACVTYLDDAVGMTPAHMDYANGVFDYGSWVDAFFMPRPCMLKFDGTVDYYLDPNDYSKKADGSPSDVADDTYGGNAMMEWGRDGQLIWVSVIPDSNSEDGSSYTVRIANYEADSTFHPWSHYAYNNKIVPHFYTPIYNGTIDGSGRLRSISGKDYTAYCKNKSRAEEIAAAMANDPDANTKIWYTEILADNKLIEYLLILISKSLASQIKFGEGRTGYQWAESNLATTGLMDAKGMFYGENTTTGLGVKVFGREHRWGNQWQAEAGLINDNGTIKVKLTRGIADGSSASDYNTDATGYLTVANITPTGTSGSYIKKAKADSMGIVLPFDASGTASTYYGDGLWFNNEQLNYALRGGHCGDGSRCGAFYSVLHHGPGLRSWSLGAGLSCKPLL